MCVKDILRTCAAFRGLGCFCMHSADQIFETDACLAILDAFPAAPGHSLLVSKLPKATLLDLSAEEAAEITRELPRLCRAVQKVHLGGSGNGLPEGSLGGHDVAIPYCSCRFKMHACLFLEPCTDTFTHTYTAV